MMTLQQEIILNANELNEKDTEHTAGYRDGGHRGAAALRDHLRHPGLDSGWDPVAPG